MGGEVLENVVEPPVVHRERPAVNFQNQRIFLGRVERRRFHDPRLHPRAAARAVPHLLHLGAPLALQDGVVAAPHPPPRPRPPPPVAPHPRPPPPTPPEA